MIALLSRHLLESTLFCLLLGGLACCLRRHGAAARHSVWLIGLSKFFIPTVLLAVAGARLAFLMPAASWVSALSGKLSVVFAALLRIFPSSLNAGEATAASVGFLAVWVAGAVAMFIVWFRRLRQSHLCLTPPTDEELKALEQAKNVLGICAPIRLRCSDEAREPSLLGFLHPTITIPAGLSEQLTPLEFEAVVIHELAHARRRDNLSSAFIHCLVCIFWFHPLLWLVEKLLVAERERACDEMVIRCGTAPQVYIAGILKVCRFHLFECVVGVSPGVSHMTRSGLKNRLDLIRACHLYGPIPTVCRLLLASFGILMTVLPIAGGYCQQCLSNGQYPSRSGGPQQAVRLRNASARDVLKICAPTGSKPVRGSPGSSCGN